jgi:hypothetical protein
MIIPNELIRRTKTMIAGLDAKDPAAVKGAASALIAFVLEVVAGLDPPGPLLVFPCVGAVKEWPFSPAEIAKLREAFPSLDVVGEARKARVWILASTANRKTAHGMGRFMFRWMARAQESGRGLRASSVMPKGSDRIRPGRWCSFHKIRENAKLPHPVKIEPEKCNDCENIWHSDPPAWPSEEGGETP